MNIGSASLKTAYDWVSLKRSYRKYVNKSSVVIEIGASSIEKTKYLGRYCRSLIGVELFKERMPKNFKNVKYVNGDWQDLSKFIKPENADVIVSSHVIEHVPDDLKAISESYKVLKPGGMMIISTPNRRRLTRTIIELFTGKKKFPYLKHEHMREYIERDLIKLLSKSPFNKFKIKPVTLGLQGGNFYCYLENVPNFLRRFANVWEIHLFK